MTVFSILTNHYRHTSVSISRVSFPPSQNSQAIQEQLIHIYKCPSMIPHVKPAGGLFKLLLFNAVEDISKAFDFKLGHLSSFLPDYIWENETSVLLLLLKFYCCS